jgi:O-methyltransferase domain
MTGESAFRRVHGMSAWEYRERNPAAGELFDRAMAESAGEVTAAIVGAYDFAGAELVVDVGGGRGLLLAAILAEHPRVRGILIDRPRVVAEAESVLGRPVCWTGAAPKLAISSMVFPPAAMSTS